MLLAGTERGVHAGIGDHVSPYPTLVSERGGWKIGEEVKAICGRLFTKSIRPSRKLLMKTIRHTVNVPSEMEQLLKERVRDFRSLSAYFVSLAFTDLLYLPKRPIAKAFANAGWQQQLNAIENIVGLRKHGWKGVNLHLHLDAVKQVEKVAVKCLKKGDWVLDHIEEELAFMRGEDSHR